MEGFVHFSHQLCILVWLIVYQISNKIAASSVILGDPECYNTAGNRYAVYFVNNSDVDSRNSTYKQVAWIYSEDNLSCTKNFTVDTITPCQQFSGSDVTLPFKKPQNYSVIRCELKPVGMNWSDIKAIHLKNQVTDESSTKQIHLLTRCYCIWSEIFPDVEIGVDTSSSNTLAMSFRFNFSNDFLKFDMGLNYFSVKVFLRIHSTKYTTTKETCSYSNIGKKARCDLGDLQPCKIYSLIFEISHPKCDNSIHTIEKTLPTFYRQNLYIDSNSFTCENSGDSTVISWLYNSRLEKNFYYFLKYKNQVVQNGSFDEKAITVYSQFDMKIKVCQYECICSNYVSLTCLQNVKQMNFINKILVLLACSILIIILAIFCVKKAKNWKETDNLSDHFMFDENDLNLSDMSGKNYLDFRDIITPRSKEIIFADKKVPIMNSRRNSTDYEKVLQA